MKNKQNQKAKNCGNKNCGSKDCGKNKEVGGKEGQHGFNHGGNV